MLLNIRKTAVLISSVFILLGMNTANAALVNFEIEGTVILSGSNVFGLSAGEHIYATGTIDDSLFGANMNTILFNSDSAYTLTIDVNGTIFTDANDTSADGALFTFTDGLLTNFDFQNLSFSSLGTIFDDKNIMAGQWGTVTTSPVPVPAAAWLFGSGLLGLVGVARRKTT